MVRIDNESNSIEMPEDEEIEGHYSRRREIYQNRETLGVFGKGELQEAIARRRRIQQIREQVQKATEEN
jgi:hypothetical protein